MSVYEKESRSDSSSVDDAKYLGCFKDNKADRALTLGKKDSATSMDHEVRGGSS